MTMILISYDISDDKLRTKFMHYIERFGSRLQYSVYEIENSGHILDNIITDISNTFEPIFSEKDSVIIIKTSKTCEIKRMGYARHRENTLEIV